MDFYEALEKIMEVETIIKGDEDTRNSVASKLADAAKKKRKKIIRTPAGKDKETVSVVSQTADNASVNIANAAAGKLGIR